MSFTLRGIPALEIFPRVYHDAQFGWKDLVANLVINAFPVFIYLILTKMLEGMY